MLSVVTIHILIKARFIHNVWLSVVIFSRWIVPYHAVLYEVPNLKQFSNGVSFSRIFLAVGAP